MKIDSSDKYFNKEALPLVCYCTPNKSIDPKLEEAIFQLRYFACLTPPQTQRSERGRRPSHMGSSRCGTSFEGAAISRVPTNTWKRVLRLLLL